MQIYLIIISCCLILVLSVCLSLRSVQREQTVDVFLYEIYSWSPCRESSNTTCYYRHVFILHTWYLLYLQFPVGFIQQL